MRVAIISDIHGNLVALETVLSTIEDEVDRIVCLGDVAAVGPQPHETIVLLRKMKWPCVMGNADESLAKSIPEDYEQLNAPEEKRRMKALDRWTRAQLSGSDRRFLSKFKPTITVKGPQNSLYCYHGSPRSNTEGIPATMPDDQAAKILGDHSATIFAGGHTHAQMVRRLGSSIVMNPGSVGLPFVRESTGRIRNPTWAEYSIVSFKGQELNVELRRAKYDLAKLRRAVKESGMPDPDWWLSDWF